MVINHRKEFPLHTANARTRLCINEELFSFPHKCRRGKRVVLQASEF